MDPESPAASDRGHRAASLMSSGHEASVPPSLRAGVSHFSLFGGHDRVSVSSLQNQRGIAHICTTRLWIGAKAP